MITRKVISLAKTFHMAYLSVLPQSIIMGLKDMLKPYNNLWSGSRQQDACECLVTFMDLIHKGTKYPLMADNDEDDNTISIANDMFLTIYQKIFTYRICGDSVSYVSQSRMLNILQIENCSMEPLLEHSSARVVSQVVHKNWLHATVILNMLKL